MKPIKRRLTIPGDDRGGQGLLPGMPRKCDSPCCNNDNGSAPRGLQGLHPLPGVTWLHPFPWGYRGYTNSQGNPPGPRVPPGSACRPHQ